ncbi:MAG: TonB-dependent receptor [Polyangiales bacterium]
MPMPLSARRTLALCCLLTTLGAHHQVAHAQAGSVPAGGAEGGAVPSAPTQPAVTPEGLLPPPPPPPPQPPTEPAPAAPEPEPGLGLEAPSVAQGVVGRVIDAATGEGMIEAQVSVIDRGERTVTDLEGNFALTLPPGTYSLRSFYELYEPSRVDAIVVEPGKATRVEIKLRQQGDATAMQEEFVVTARADRATDATQLQIRRESVSVRDAISAQEISRSGSTNAADAVRRVVSATVDTSNRLIVRGLGSRYTRVLLHGFRIPSTDPDDPGVELDLFPAGVLSNLAVLKTFTPDLPGDFAGGVMQVETRDFPKDFLLQTNLSLGYNSQATFRDVLTYKGGKTDWLGFDDGSRALPDSIPNARVTSMRTPGVDARFTPADIDAFGRAFENDWNVGQSTGQPNYGVGIIVGDTIDVGKRDLGYLFSFGYAYRTERRVSHIRDTPVGSAPDGSHPLLTQDSTRYVDERGRQTGSWGALGTLSYELSERNDLTLTSLFSQSGGAEANFAEGQFPDRQFVAQRRLRWVERQLWFAQLRGEHRELPALHDLTIDWNLSVARAARDEPDTRSLRYDAVALDVPYQWAFSNRSPQRFFSTLTDWTVGGQLDLTLPVVDALKLKAGAQTRNSFSEFRSRRFVYSPTGSDTARLQLPPEQLFAPENFGSFLTLNETTRKSDGYDAKSGLYAGYALAEVVPVKPLRLIAGARLESYHQELNAASPTAPDEPIAEVRDSVLDALPSAAVIYQLAPEMYLRASYGKTVARPLFRELAPFLYEDEIRRIVVTGNPDLKRSQIHNVDLRWELFPTDSEVLAVSGFYKRFDDPIEPYNIAQQRSFQNAEGAKNLGGELEGRLSLARLSPSLTGFSAGFNFTYVWSRIEIANPLDMTTANTSRRRPLAGQSPYVANVSLGFTDPDAGSSLFLYYNVYGKRIDQVGANFSPDQYEQAFHSLDMIGNYNFDAHWALRLTAKNLLFRETRIKEGPLVRERFNPGTVVTLSGGYSY